MKLARWGPIAGLVALAIMLVLDLWVVPVMRRGADPRWWLITTASGQYVARDCRFAGTTAVCAEQVYTGVRSAETVSVRPLRRGAEK